MRQFGAAVGQRTVLDSGAGTGALALALAPLVRKVIAIDIVEELLEHGRRAAEGLDNVSFVKADATALPFERDAFDLAACHARCTTSPVRSSSSRSSRA